MYHLLLAYPGCPGKEAVKRVSVCLVLDSESQLKRSSAPSLAVNEEKMRPGHWLGSIFRSLH